MRKKNPLLAGLLLVCVLFGALSLKSGAAGYSQATNLPTLYIELDNGMDSASINKDDYLPAAFTLAGAEGFDNIIEAPVSIKGRGNATWDREKKPFALKFAEKTDLFGMGKAKKWVLLANYYDKTLLRNALTLSLGKELGIAYTPEWKFVDLYLNGIYQGNYLLTEKVEIGKERVNIDDQQGGVLFEIEQQYRHRDCTYCHETPAGVHLTYKEPEEKDIGSETMRALMETNNAYLDALEAAILQGYETYSQYIDVDSFINWYLLNEFAKNYDSAFVTSCYCYRDSGGKLFMGPPWDYDTCYGNQDVATGLNPAGYHVRQAPWYTLLMQDRDFRRLLMDRWTTLSEQGVFENIGSWIDRNAAWIAESQKLDEQRWPNAMTFTGVRGSGPFYQTFGEEVAYMKDFITRRAEWLDTQWNTKRYGQQSSLTHIEMRSDRIDLSSLAAPDGMANEMAVNLFDLDPTTKYCTPASLPLEISWKMKEPTRVTTYALITANDSPGRDPVQWRLQGSLDGVEWVTIDEVREGGLPEERFAEREYIVDSPGSYSYYRIQILRAKNSDGYVQLSEWMLGGYDTAHLLAADQALSALEETESLSCRPAYQEAQAACDRLSETERSYLSDISRLESVRSFLDQRLGDVNQDGIITPTDALLVLQHTVELKRLAGEPLMAGDADGDRVLGAVDALLILQRTVQLNDTFLT